MYLRALSFFLDLLILLLFSQGQPSFNVSEELLPFVECFIGQEVVSLDGLCLLKYDCLVELIVPGPGHFLQLRTSFSN